VDVSSTNPVVPYINWSTAATNIQDAIDAARVGDLVLVTNGFYAAGGRAQTGNLASNRVVVDKPITVQSVLGPAGTFIAGASGIRCAYLASNAVLSGFTLTSGNLSELGASTEYSGGAVFCETSAIVRNCVLTNNAAIQGGGAYSGTLSNCTLSGNFADEGGGTSGSRLYNCYLNRNSSSFVGGGVWNSILYNCVVTGSSVVWEPKGAEGGAAGTSTLYNCTVVGNGVIHSVISSVLYNCIIGGNAYSYDNASVLNYCCTFPMPTNGVGNITNPALLDGNLRLQSNSACINAGKNIYATTDTDLDGNPRIVGGAVDIGAYEFQNPRSVISYAWLQNYALPIDGSADAADPDQDGMNNWQEWIAGTDPTNAASVLKLLPLSNSPSGVAVSWQSVPDRAYSVFRSTSLPAFSPLATNIQGQTNSTSFLDTNGVGAGPFFYRIGVQSGP
jgi:hypothetical protein